DPHHLALAAKKGLAKLNIDSGELKYLSTLYPTSEEQTKMRTNDGNVDVKGRFWFGTMTSFGLGPPKTEGTLFRSDPDLSLHVMKHPITVPNGLAFSPDNAYLYFTDTRLSTIFRYTFSSETGAISNEEEFIVFTAEKYGPGSPDGLAISEDGDLWVAIFNGHRVLRIDAQSKEVKGAIEFPSSRQVACPRFVGQGLLVTTGKLVHMDPEVGKGHSPHAGDVFWVPDVGVRGREIYKAKLHQ
ncbi:rRNA-processing protein cgr1, partial [Rhizina undulata]